MVLGYWLAQTALPPTAANGNAARSVGNSNKNPLVDESATRFRTGVRLPSRHDDPAAAMAGALEGQRVLVFKNQAAVAGWLAKLGDRVRLLGRLDTLHALRVGFADYDDLLALLDGEQEQSFIFPVNAPSPGEGTVQPGAVALDNNLLDWLGIKGNNSDWGRGVVIAILDTGVVANSAFHSSIQAITFVDLPADPAAQNGHGTAVASMIIGSTDLTPGVAPGATILSVRIANDDGQSDSFLLAKGIVAAVDAGARLINISMGSFGDSYIVRNAIDYANQNGALIVAAVGNNGINQVAYPAANDGVIAVGSVDGLGNPLAFSNTGREVAMAAPGYAVNAAWTNEQAVRVSGTSFSAPIVTGSIAAIMTQGGAGNLTPSAAYQLLVSYLNDGGAAGKDAALGGGMPDIGRVLNGTTPGIYDAALAATSIIAPDAGHPYGQVEILVQNRGTETLINTGVQVSTGAGVVAANITALAPNAVQSVRLPITQPPSAYPNGLQVDSKVVLSGGVIDAKPSNDRRVETYVAGGSP